MKSPLNVLQSLLFNGLDFLYPPHCVFCGELLPERADFDGNEQRKFLLFCSRCVGNWIPHDKSPCPKCGTFFFTERLSSVDSLDEDAIYDDEFYFLQEMKESRTRCVRCASANFSFASVIPLGEYDESLRDAVLRMKRDKRGLLTTQSAALLYQQRREELHAIGAERVIPVPMHAIRRFIRGVNSPELIAAELARRLDRPVLPKFVCRIRATKPQFNLEPKQRAKNVQGAFALTKNASLEEIADKTILLVDDILTTGSTSNELAKLLIKNSAKKVVVCVLARSVIEKKA